jgi:predicted PurR-regulated permease PerM
MVDATTSTKTEGPAEKTLARGNSATVRTCLIIIATIAIIAALQWAKLFFIPLAVAIFATFWLMPVVDMLHRWRIPRGLGAAVVLFLTLFAIVGSGYALRDDARDFLNGLSKATHQTRVAFNKAARDPNGWLHHVRTTINDRSIASPNAKSDIVGEGVSVSLMESSATLAAAAVDVTVVLFLIYLLLASGDLFKRKLLVVISGHLSRKRLTVDILRGIGVQFQRYLAVLVTTNVAIGLLTWALFAAMGVENAAIWGVAAGVLHVIPYLGPAIIAAASLLVTSAQFNSLSQAFLVASGSLLISALIGMLLTTWLASRASHMNSAAVFTGLLFWGWLWGIPGLLLGTPIMMATKVMADRIDSLNWLGTFLGDAPKRVTEKPVVHDTAAPEKTAMETEKKTNAIPTHENNSSVPKEASALHSAA